MFFKRCNLKRELPTEGRNRYEKGYSNLGICSCGATIRLNYDPGGELRSVTPQNRLAEDCRSFKRLALRSHSTLTIGLK